MSSADTEAPEEAEAERVDEARQALLAEVEAELGDAVVGSHIRVDHALWIRVDRSAWRTAAEVAKRKLGFDHFDFLSAIDWLPSPFGRDMDSQEDLVVHGEEPREPEEMAQGYAGGDTRFQLLASVVSMPRATCLLLKADLPDDDLSADSWVSTFAGANWHERECHEMFGIDFVGHPGLAPLYLPSGFEGHPLRKDYPLLARRVKPWPGIVDVEPMPTDEDDEADGEGGGS